MTTSQELAKELKKRGVSGHWIGRPTLTELLEIMPGDWSLYNNPDGTYGIDWFTEDEFIKHFDFDKNICDCVAKCLIYLMDNGFVQIREGKVIV